MKPELNLDAPGYADARAAWRGAPRAAAAAAGPGRNFWIGLLAAVLVASVALALSSGQFRPRGFGPYSVSVPLTFKPYDPTRWAVMNSDSAFPVLQAWCFSTRRQGPVVSASAWEPLPGFRP